jgi:hypothetical protein
MYEVEYYYAKLGIAVLIEVMGSIYEGKAVTAITTLETTANQGPKQGCLAASSHFNIYIATVVWV